MKERGKDEEVNGQGGKRGAPAPHGAAKTRLKTKDTRNVNWNCN